MAITTGIWSGQHDPLHDGPLHVDRAGRDFILHDGIYLKSFLEVAMTELEKLRISNDALIAQNTQLKTLIAAKNNEIEKLRESFQIQSVTLHQLRTELSRQLVEGRFKQEVKTLVS